MATYKFVFLADPDVTVNQSRGLSIQINGYAPISLPSDKRTYFSDKIDSNEPIVLDDAVKDGAVILFKDIQYLSTDGYPVPKTRAYYAALYSPGSHMFQDQNVEAADEFKVVGENDKSVRGQMVVEIPMSDTMFGSNLSGQTTIDAIVLYGQAYNRDFTSEFQQGDIEKTVPIGLLFFTDQNSRLVVDPATESKMKTMLRFSITLVTGEDVDVTPLEQNESFDLWNKFRGQMHVVNDGLGTSGSFIIRDHEVLPIDDRAYSDSEDEGARFVSSGKCVDFESRVFFTNDVPDGNESDNNVCYGSPARLTVLTTDPIDRENPEPDDAMLGKLPQSMVGKVSYHVDENNYRKATVEGIVESYYTSARTKTVKGRRADPKPGSVYDVDWIAKSKPAFSFFNDSPDFLFAEPSYCDYLYNSGSNLDTHQQYDNANYAANSACFANGGNFFTTESQSVGDGLNINTYRVISRGNALIMNSSRCSSFTRSGGKYKYNTFMSNCQDVNVKTRIKGRASDETFVDKGEALNLLLNDWKIDIDNTGPGIGSIIKPDVDSRATVIASNRLAIRNSDNVVAIGINGWNDGTDRWSNFADSKDVTALGGAVNTKLSIGCFIIGTESNEEGQNKIEGASVDGGTYFVKNSFILGNNCRITSEFRKYWVQGSTPEYSDESDVFMMGYDLRNDSRQSNHMDAHLRVPTYILGCENAPYYEPGRVKTLVNGGYFTADDVREDFRSTFRYNSFEHSIAKKDDKNTEALWTLTDVKGRSIDYGSSSIDLRFLNGSRSPKNFAEKNFQRFGRINLFKLYQLLSRMYWEKDKNSDDLVIKFKKGYHESPELSRWFDYDANGGTVLANLIDDTQCHYAYAPQQPI